MNIFAVRAVCLAVAALSAGCGALQTRDFVHKETGKNAQDFSDAHNKLRASDQKFQEPVREIQGVWLGRKTVKVSRDADLPAVFSQIISFQFPDRPSLTVVSDRVSKIVGLPVRVSPDALIPIEQFSMQRMGSAAGTAASGGINPAVGGMAPNGAGLPGVPGAPVRGMPTAMGALGAVPNMSSLMNGPNSGMNRPFVLDMSSPYNGTLKDLLDQLSARYGVGWDFKDGVILISRLVTRTYQVASLIDTNETRTAVSKSGATSTAGSGGGSGGISQVSNSSSSTDVTSRVESKVDVLDGMRKSIEATLTPNVGKFSISSFGIITVTDTREIQDQVRELVEAENKAIGRQVRLRIVMVEVDATTKNDTGFDWTWAIDAAARKWNVDFSTPAGMLGGGTANSGQIGVIRNGQSSTTSSFIKALGEVGRVSLKRDETYTLMNNRPLAVAQAENFVYPARSTSAAVVSGSTAGGVPGVEPGQLTTGNFLNLRASVQPNGSVIVHFALDSSRRGKVETFNSNGSVLQYPQSSSGNYQTYTTVASGDTGVIAAIDSNSQESNDRSFDTSVTPILGGGMYSNVVRKRILLLLTPVVIEGAS